MRLVKAAVLLLLSIVADAGKAQTLLAKAFAEMKSSDPTISQAAKDNFINLLVQEMPSIEKDAGTLCNALSDSDTYIRLQAAGIFLTIVEAAPSHNQVVLACSAGLIKAASDPDTKVRNDALFALAENPAGPPPQAHNAFVNALQETTLRTADAGATGLLREIGIQRTKNEEIVTQALLASRDSRLTWDLLDGIGRSYVRSETLFQAAQRYLYVPNSDLQAVAIQVLAVTAISKTQLTDALQRYLRRKSISAENRLQAQTMLYSLQH